MTGSSPPNAPSRRFPPLTRSASDARRFVTSALAGLDRDLLDTVQLLTSEVVTNAILHAGTDLEVRVWASGDRVHVSVFDETPDRTPARREDDTDATTGRGLHIVEAAASAYGTEISPDGKAVWFELWSDPDPARPTGWGTPALGSGSSTAIQLRGVPVGLCRAASRHRRTLLREARLALSRAGCDIEVSLDELVAATEMSDAMDLGLEEQLYRLGPQAPSFDWTITLPSDRTGGAPGLVSVLDRLDSASRRGLLLTRPALAEIRQFRTWVAGQITEQAGGAPPAAWSRPTVADQAETAAPPLEWDLSPLGEQTPTVAADDDNRIIAINDAAGRLLGWDPGQIQGKRLVTIIPEDWRDRHVSGFTEFLLNGRSRIIGNQVRLPALRRDGTVVEADVRITVEQSRQGRTVFVARLSPADDT